MRRERKSKRRRKRRRRRGKNPPASWISNWSWDDDQQKFHLNGGRIKFHYYGPVHVQFLNNQKSEVNSSFLFMFIFMFRFVLIISSRLISAMEKANNNNRKFKSKNEQQIEFHINWINFTIFNIMCEWCFVLRSILDTLDAYYNDGRDFHQLQ